MNRRHFIVSAMMSAAGSALSAPRTATAGERPLPVEKSPVPVHAGKVRITVVAGETVLTSCSGESISLNEAGAAIWHAIDGRRNCHGVAEILCRHFSLGHEVVAADVTEFVEALVSQGYLKIARMTPCYSLAKTGARAALSNHPA